MLLYIDKMETTNYTMFIKLNNRLHKIKNKGVLRMENTFVVNIIHRPEMVPEYAEKVTGQGKAEEERHCLQSHWTYLNSSRRRRIKII